MARLAWTLLVLPAFGKQARFAQGLEPDMARELWIGVEPERLLSEGLVSPNRPTRLEKGRRALPARDTWAKGKLGF